MPPAISTTSRPDAMMPMKALDVRRSNRFGSVRKLSVANPSASTIARITASSQNSWLRRKRVSAGANAGRAATRLTRERAQDSAPDCAGA